MAAIFLGIAAFVVTIGVLLLSQATQGVGAIAAGLFLAIVARIVQARAQHNELLKKLESRN